MSETQLPEWELGSWKKCKLVVENVGELLDRSQNKKSVAAAG
jgi:hypothetical protein